MNSLQKIILQSLLFVLFYIQPLHVFGSLTFSIITQISAFIYCAWTVFIRTTKRNDYLTISSIMLGLKPLINPTSVSHNFVSALQDAFKYSLFSIFLLYFRNIKTNVFKLSKIITFLSTFLILSSLPYLFNILKPAGREYDLQIYGSDSSAFIGFFFNAHCASTVISISCLNLIYFIYIYPSKQYKTIFNKIVLVLGIFVLYKTYVRTGYFMFLTGATFLGILEFRIKNLFQYIFYASSIVLIIFITVNNDQVLYNRIFDKYNNSENNNAINSIGSGRLLFQLKAIEILKSGTQKEILLGIGSDNLSNRMNEKIGLKIMTHSGFFDALLKEGIIGFLIFVLFLTSILRFIIYNRASKYYSLNLATFLSYFFFQVVQGGIIFPVIEFMIALNISLLYHDVARIPNTKYAKKNT